MAELELRVFLFLVAVIAGGLVGDILGGHDGASVGVGGVCCIVAIGFLLIELARR